MATTTQADNNALLTKVIERQRMANLSDYQFAEKLGVPRSLWQLTRTGYRAVGITLLKAIVRTFPDMGLDVIDFLRDGDKSNDQQPPNRSVIHEGKPRSLWD